jgi:hypothetical protein
MCGFARDARKCREDRERSAGKIDRLLARLAVWQEQQTALEVHMLPSGMKDFTKAGAGQDYNGKLSSSMSETNGRRRVCCVQSLRRANSVKSLSIADESPVKTVCEAFGSRTTAQGWRKTMRLAFLGKNPINGEILESLMRGAGERYKADGRSASAITRRGARN